MREIKRREFIKLLILLLSIASITIVTLIVVFISLNPVPCDSGGNGG